MCEGVQGCWCSGEGPEEGRCCGAVRVGGAGGCAGTVMQDEAGTPEQEGGNRDQSLHQINWFGNGCNFKVA